MTRFAKDLSGQCGEFWRKEAEKELKRVADDLASGKITIDENGVGRNCIGRVLMDDMVEKVSYVTDAIDAKATKAAYEEETAAFLAEYRKNARPATAEELAEMRAEFGKGKTVVNVLTGQVYHL